MAETFYCPDGASTETPESESSGENTLEDDPYVFTEKRKVPPLKIKVVFEVKH